MTPFASVAIYRRGSGTVFKPPRREHPADVTQARKAASRFWRGSVTPGDVLLKVCLVREVAGRLEVCEREEGAGSRPWAHFVHDVADMADKPHVAACLKLLDIDPERANPPMPDVLEINGVIYRREI